MRAARAMVVEEFGEPLVEREIAAPEPEPGAVLVRVTAAGICGSDLDIWRGDDPRIRLPLILGHEGVGRVEALGGEKADFVGLQLRDGDLVVWDRGLTCGDCYQCVVKRRPALCPRRAVYGITLPTDAPPHLNGCYAELIYLRPETRLLKVSDDVPDRLLTPTTCSGATAAHSAELAGVEPGDTVVVLGPGPLGLFAVAFALEAGARQVLLFGTRRGLRKMELGREFGAAATVNISETEPGERLSLVHEATEGRGADVVIDAAGNRDSVQEAVKLAAPGGTVALPGVATPMGDVGLDIYADIVRKNVRVQGVWVSDTRHLYQAVQLVLSRRYPFEKMVTHRLPLQRANEALAAQEAREGIKIVLEP